MEHTTHAVYKKYLFIFNHLCPTVGVELTSTNINVAESAGNVSICVRVSSGTVSSPGAVTMSTISGSADRGTLS